MFKHGIAYLERGGPASGPFELAFKRDEMSDVLKSLAVWVAEGSGVVTSVSFDSPEDPEAVLRDRGLLFEKGAAFRYLVHALRGRDVELDLGSERKAGELLGLESIFDNEARHRQRLALRLDDSSVELVDADVVKRIRLRDPSSRADMRLLVEKSRELTARERRAVRVELEGDAADLRLAYTIAAPIWRVSYRLMVADDMVTVMAWGIVHNPVEEDLSGVELTLTTGQPVSFVIDLYAPRHVVRAHVEEQSRAVAAPRQFERGAPPPPAAAPQPRMKAAQASYGPAAFAAAAPLSADLAEHAFQASAEGVDRGEYFEYRVRTPLSLERGGSAMVPLVSSKVKAVRERIWRPGQGPAPDLVLRFDNETGVVLEEGPAVVYDAGGYAGEAMVPYSARGVEVRLGFARDLAVRCSEKTTSEVYMAGLEIGDAAAIETAERRLKHHLRAENDHDEPVTVVFELPRAPGREFMKEGPVPTELTASYYRFAVTVPARDKLELEPVERWRESMRIDLGHLDAARLEHWIAGRFVDEIVEQSLREVLALWDRAQKLDKECEVLRARSQRAQEGQQRLKQQLEVLRDAGDEGSLRLRYVQKLAAHEDEIARFEADIDARRAEAEQLRREARDKLAAVTSG
jgi:hypothetical protein